MRFREDNPAELARVRAAAAAWREQNPRVRLGLVPDEFDQVVRLQAFRTAHPEVIIGDSGFGTLQARIPEPNGEIVITRYRLVELLDKLDELTGERPGQPGGDPG